MIIHDDPEDVEQWEKQEKKTTSSKPDAFFEPDPGCIFLTPRTYSAPLATGFPNLVKNCSPSIFVYSIRSMELIYLYT